MKYWFPILGVACGAPAERAPTLHVLAPSALEAVLEPAVRVWEQDHPCQVRFGFDTPDRLMRQANAGAHADVFISADTEWMDALVLDGHIDPSTRVSLAHDPLVFLTTPDQVPIHDPADLVRLPAPRLGLLAANVPEGRIAQRALEETRVWETIRDGVTVVGSGPELVDELDSGALWLAVARRSTGLIGRNTLQSYPFSPEHRLGSEIEAAPMGDAKNPCAAHTMSLIEMLRSSPVANEAWTQGGLSPMHGNPQPHGLGGPQPAPGTRPGPTGTPLPIGPPLPTQAQPRPPTEPDHQPGRPTR